MKIRIPITRRTRRIMQILGLIALILVGCFLAAVYRLNTGT